MHWKKRIERSQTKFSKRHNAIAKKSILMKSNERCAPRKMVRTFVN